MRVGESKKEWVRGEREETEREMRGERGTERGREGKAHRAASTLSPSGLLQCREDKMDRVKSRSSLAPAHASFAAQWCNF